MAVRKSIEFTALLVVLLIAAIPNGASIGEYIEGRYLPVSDKAEIVEIHKVQGNWTYFSMKAKKLRSCVWLKTEMYIGARDGGAGAYVPFEHLDKPQVRDEGEIFFSQNRTLASPDQLLHGSFMNAYHQCPGWFRIWRTRTAFYDGVEGIEGREGGLP